MKNVNAEEDGCVVRPSQVKLRFGIAISSSGFTKEKEKN